MENNKAYLTKLPLIFLLFVVSVIIQLFFWKFNGDTENKNYILSFARAIFNDAVFFICLGIALNKWKKAMISLAIASAVVCLKIFLYEIKGGDESSADRNYILSELFYLLPYIFFLYEKGLTFKKLVIVIGVILLFRGIEAVYYLQQALKNIDDLFETQIIKKTKYISIVVFSCLNMIKLIFYSELYNYVKNANMRWQPRLLNPGNVYDKAGSTILFFSIKVFLLAAVIGMSCEIENLRFYVNSQVNNPFKFYYYNSMFSISFGVVVVLLAAWYLRKFLLEYFMSYNIHSRFVYWLLILPGIGFIAWVVLLTNERSKTFTEKVAAINNFASSSPQGVVIITVILMIFQILFNLSNGIVGGSILVLIIGFTLFFWMVNRRSGYYFNLYLTLSLLAILFVYIFFVAKRNEFSLLSVLVSVLVFNAAQLVMIYPVFHYEDFTYLNEEEVKTENNEDRLTEFEM